MSIYARYIDGDRLQVFDNSCTVLATSDPVTGRRHTEGRHQMGGDT